MRTIKNHAAEFVRLYGISEYTVRCFIEVFEKLGFNVLHSEEQATKFFGKNYNSESTSFVKNSTQIRLVYLNSRLSDDAKCHILCKLLYLRSFPDSRLCSQELIVSSEIFASCVRQAVENNNRELKINSLISKFGLSFVALIVSAFSLITTIFAYIINAKFVNAFENRDYAVAENSVYDTVDSSTLPIDDNISIPVVTETDNFVPDGYISYESAVSASTFSSPMDDIDTVDNVDNVDTIEHNDTESEHDNETSYYVTQSGKKYHTADCYYVKDKTKCSVLKKEELSSYEPCKKCIE